MQKKPLKPGRKKHLKPAFREVHIRVYKFIDKFITKYKFSPNYLRISKGVNVCNRHAYRLVEDLIKLGYLKKDPDIKIVKEL